MAKTKEKNQEEIDFEQELGPKKRAMPSDSVEKKSRKKKKKKGGKKRLIIIIVAAVLLIGIGVGLFLLSRREGGLVSLLPFSAEYQSMLDLEAELEVKSAELDAREKDISAEESRLSVLEAQLQRQQTQLEQTSSYGGNYADYVENLTEEKVEEIMRVGTIYSKMEAEDAARILTELYETNEISIIMYYMKPVQAALVLTYMDTSLAAQITRNLVN